MDLLEKNDYCGLVSGEKTDKSHVFDVFYGSLKTAPMIKECPVNLECQLIQMLLELGLLFSLRSHIAFKLIHDPLLFSGCERYVFQ